jgi:hypothetical protein
MQLMNEHSFCSFTWGGHSAVLGRNSKLCGIHAERVWYELSTANGKMKLRTWLTNNEVKQVHSMNIPRLATVTKMRPSTGAVIRTKFGTHQTSSGAHSNAFTSAESVNGSRRSRFKPTAPNEREFRTRRHLLAHLTVKLFNRIAYR